VFNGCVEHIFVYQSDLNGICNFKYTAKGDSTDIYTPPGTTPDTIFFHITTSSEVDTAGNKKFILEATRKIPGDSLPTTLNLADESWADVYLSHPTELKKTYFFWRLLTNSTRHSRAEIEIYSKGRGGIIFRPNVTLWKLKMTAI